jgi:hypothetical protein
MPAKHGQNSTHMMESILLLNTRLILKTSYTNVWLVFLIDKDSVTVHMYIYINVDCGKLNIIFKISFSSKNFKKNIYSFPIILNTAVLQLYK